GALRAPAHARRARRRLPARGGRAVTIRRARPADTDAVLALWGAARSAAAATTDDAGAVAGAIEQGALLVAEDGGAVVGTIVAGWDGWRGNMYRLAVAPSHRR